MRTFLDAKEMAKAVREMLDGKGIVLQHSEALDIVARQFGAESWNVLSAKIAAADRTPAAGEGAGDIVFTPPVPILRIFDEARAREFKASRRGKNG